MGQDGPSTGGLGVGGSTSPEVESLSTARKQMASGSSATNAVYSSLDARATLQVVATSEVAARLDGVSTGGWSMAGLSQPSSSTVAESDGGWRTIVTVDSEVSLQPQTGGGWAAGGDAADTLHGFAVASVAKSVQVGTSPSQAHRLEVRARWSLGGVGPPVVTPPGRSFKHWFRGRAVGVDTSSRAGDLAGSYRGWPSLPTLGRIGASEVILAAAGGLRTGGSFADLVQSISLRTSVGRIGSGGAATRGIETRVDVVSDGLRLGGGGEPTFNHGHVAPFAAETGGEASHHQHAAASFMVATGLGGRFVAHRDVTARTGGGTAARLAGTPTVATGLYGQVALTTGGTASVLFASADLTQAALSIGGHAQARHDASHGGTAGLAAGSGGVPRLTVAAQVASRLQVGATATVAQQHGRVAAGQAGLSFGGDSRGPATYDVQISGGLRVGGNLRIAGLLYRVYANDGQGGVINYTSPIAEVAGLSWTTDELHPGSYRFGVRAYDPASGLEEENLDASIALILDSEGRDATNVPAPPVGLRAIDRGAGRVRFEWTATGSPAIRRASRFHLYLAPGSITDFSMPYAVVPTATERGETYAAEVDSLADGVHYEAIVRAYNEFGEENNLRAIHITPDRTPPSRVDGLSAIVTASVA